MQTPCLLRKTGYVTMKHPICMLWGRPLPALKAVKKLLSSNFREHPRLWYNMLVESTKARHFSVYLSEKYLVNLDLKTFRTIKNQKSFDGVEIRKFHEHRWLYFYPIGFTSFFTDESDPRRPSLRENILLFDFNLVPRKFCFFFDSSSQSHTSFFHSILIPG